MKNLTKTIVLAALGYGSYTAAWACSCGGGSPGEDDIAVVGILRGGSGCGRTSNGRLELTDVLQDPTGQYSVGDTLPVRVNTSGGASCGVDFGPGDEVYAYGQLRNGRLDVALCNSFGL